MIKSYQCPKCKNYYSEQDFTLHYDNCKSPIQNYTAQVYKTSPITNINTYTTQAYDTNGIQNTNTYINTYNPSNYLNNYNTSSNTVYVTNPTPIITQNANILLPQQKEVITNVQKQPFRPQTITYFNPILNQTNLYSGVYQNQANYNSNSGLLQYQTTKNPINNNKNLSTNANININSTYICKLCKKTIPAKEQKDHILSHKLEQEEKDRLQAQTLQDEDLFENLPPEQIEQQRKIEEYIRRQRTQRQNNNNLMNNGFNINDNMGNLGRMGVGGFPNIIIRRTTTTNNNNDLNNLSSGMGSPGFFENFFNGNVNLNNDLNNDFMNMPSGGMRRIIIPMGMGGMGNIGGMGQNNLNELIERMLHYRRDNPTDAAIVSELPETKIDDINKLDNDKKNCVICMEDFKNGDVSTNLPCLHMFHTNCIQSWLKTQNTCPICKFQLTQENINNINNNNPS